jgi:hypothetical protein
MNISNFGDLRQFFDLKGSNQETKDLLWLCNAFIHSVVFQPVTERAAESSI